MQAWIARDVLEFHSALQGGGRGGSVRREAIQA
jgi:hypothetical protein